MAPTCIRSIKAGTTLYISGTTALGSSAVEDIDQLDVILEGITRIVESEGRGLKEYGLYDYVCYGHVQILAQIIKKNMRKLLP